MLPTVCLPCSPQAKEKTTFSIYPQHLIYISILTLHFIVIKHVFGFLSHYTVNSLEAEMVLFQCPLCFQVLSLWAPLNTTWNMTQWQKHTTATTSFNITFLKWSDSGQKIFEEQARGSGNALSEVCWLFLGYNNTNQRALIGLDMIRFLPHIFCFRCKNV